ncbi:MAG: hypothetical protein SFT81_04445 [Candidatus Caenarcaniphilales bacterium]|nr:hypothetical protein [Candidatus Caenarcaniphilales bacterium]
MLIVSRRTETPHIFDTDLADLDQFKHYDALELHLIIYPFSQDLSPSDLVSSPYAEYSQEITSNHNSLYERVGDLPNTIFGLLLGLTLAFIFFQFNRDDLLTIESVVSIMAAYFIGKDLWDDLAKFLVGFTQSWSLSFQPPFYFYQLVKNPTLIGYAKLARQHRYGRESLFPERFDLIEHANSQVLRLYFTHRELKESDGDHANILTFSIKPDKLLSFREAGFMFGMKLKLVRRFLWLEWCEEWSQSLRKYELGCLEKGDWHKESALRVQSLRLGSLHLRLNGELVPSKKMIMIQL